MKGLRLVIFSDNDASNKGNVAHYGRTHVNSGSVRENFIVVPQGWIIRAGPCWTLDTSDEAKLSLITGEERVVLLLARSIATVTSIRISVIAGFPAFDHPVSALFTENSRSWAGVARLNS